jgi:PGAP1-like protein
MPPGRRRTNDAVILIPGIMGSELVEACSGRILWGLASPRWYASVWGPGPSSAALDLLRLSAAERDGHYGRVRATRLIQSFAFMPRLTGLLPYEALRSTLLSAVADPLAFGVFPYDWRLPVAYNATQLAEFARKHLATWRAHQRGAGKPSDPGARRADGNNSAPRLVLVAHSMGGILAWLACQDPDLAKNVRATVTLGTPFFGAPKSALLLASGRGAKVPHRLARRLALTLPGVYDLLPAYQCVVDGSSARRLTVADVAAIGGDPQLAAASLAFSQSRPVSLPPGHVQVVGAYQPTVQSLAIDNGTVTGGYVTYDNSPGRPGELLQEDTWGDGTVPRVSAELTSGPNPFALAQSHAALASAGVPLDVALDTVLNRRTGPLLGTEKIGLEAPDVVPAGNPVEFGVTGVVLPVDASCRVTDLSTGLDVDAPVLGWRDGVIVARGRPLSPGLYQVRLDGQSNSPVTQLLLSADLSGPGDAADLDDDDGEDR